MKPGSGVRFRVGDDALLCRYTLFHSIVDAFGDELDSFIKGHDLRCVLLSPVKKRAVRFLLEATDSTAGFNAGFGAGFKARLKAAGFAAGPAAGFAAGFKAGILGKGSSAVGAESVGIAIRTPLGFLEAQLFHFCSAVSVQRLRPLSFDTQPVSHHRGCSMQCVAPSSFLLYVFPCQWMSPQGGQRPGQHKRHTNEDALTMFYNMDIHQNQPH